MSPPLSATVAAVDGGSTTLSDVHADILEAHILNRLDGPTLAAASCASSVLHSLSSQDHLWTAICHSTWPSTAADPRLRRLVSAFPGGPRAFFSLSFPTILSSPSASLAPPPQELISAVDINYKGNLIFSKVQEIETVTGWFRCSPFRIDLLDPKETVPTAAHLLEGDGACTSLAEEMTLSWVLIDPNGLRVASLSSHRPVAVHRHWLTGEVQVKFATILSASSVSELVQCGIVVTCGGAEGGEMHVSEVSMQVEDMDGMNLTGKDSLVILQRAMEGKRGNERREEEGRRRYKEYLEMKRERRERKLRNEGTLDKVCVAIGVSLFAAFCCCFLFS
ncbi:F-box family protein [Actinidia rufa]|uniref:F-box family protein n=1 Tax=Actinidia rufa TaxID=165716 RepID=A0A7J0FH47_9ERIC|nr:F-box family protein [Actinidia rufa]